MSERRGPRMAPQEGMCDITPFSLYLLYLSA